MITKENGILTKIPPKKRHQLMGEVLSVMLASDFHQPYLINDFGTAILVPIHLNQFRVYKKGQTPIGFVSWAFLSTDVAEKYRQGNYHLNFDDWKSGDELWFIDFIAPYGHIRSIVRDLKKNVFPNKKLGNSLRFKNNGKDKKIMTFR
ncbi:MAG: toxin-activating lysine-acyltransferase [Candidatus Margulisiibacteriota bacterium]